MNKPSTWLALIAAAVYVGAYWYANKDFDAIYAACVKAEPGQETVCACQREKMSDEVSLYRAITGYNTEMARLKTYATASCPRK